MYDFGDGWEHLITVKSFVESDQPLPHLIKAQNGCPPEDCGGTSGVAHWVMCLVRQDASGPRDGAGEVR